MSPNTCLMFSTGSLLSSGFHIGSLPWSGAAYLTLLLSTFMSSVVLSLVLWAHDRFAHLNRVIFWSRLLVPPVSRAALFPWWVPQSGMGSLLNFGFSIELCHLRFFSHLKTALFSRARVGSVSWVVFLKRRYINVQYEWMNHNCDTNSFSIRVQNEVIYFLHPDLEFWT